MSPTSLNHLQIVIAFWLVVSGSVHSQPFWSITTLSQSRYNLAATSVGQLALFAGGATDQGGVTGRVDIYNATSGTWTTATLSQARKWFSATAVGQLALFAGGVNSSPQVLATVDIFNSSDGTWTTASLSQPRQWLAATSVGDLAFFAGGGESVGTAIVDIFNATSGTWTTATLSQARYLLVATTVGQLALFGGGTYSSRVDIFNYTSGDWSTAALSQPRNWLAATSAGPLAFFGGGWDGYNYVATVDIFNSTSGIWTTATLSQARAHLAATSLDGLAIFGGGMNGPASAIVDIYNSTSGTWTTATLSQARDDLGAASAGQFALFGGGKAGTVASSTVDIISVSSPSLPPTIPRLKPTTQNVAFTFSNTSLQATLTVPSGQGVGLSSSNLAHISHVAQFIQNKTTTYIYYSTFYNGQSLEESFSFSPVERTIGSLIVPAKSIKWSVKVSATSPFPQGFNTSYSLSLPDGSPLVSPSHWFPNWTFNSITTYYIPLGGYLYAILEIPQLALVDNTIFIPIGQSFNISSEETLFLLQFPPFDSSLDYDPSIALAELVTSSSSSSDDALIIGATIGGGFAALLVIGGISLGLFLMRTRKVQRQLSVSF